MIHVRDVIRQPHGWRSHTGRQPLQAAAGQQTVETTKDPATATAVGPLAEHPDVLRRSGGLSGVPKTRSHLELGR